MVSIRPYGSPMLPELALNELRRGAGRQFDPHCVTALAEYLEEHPFELHASASRRFARDRSAA
jgi:HD-GYP domain-containing protein (c-di-GMP phosphodiesterase class II)